MWWAVSPDGTKIAAQESGAPVRIYDVNGSPPREVPGLTGREVPVGWITEGLLVMHPDDPASPLGQIYKFDISTGRQAPWNNILPRDRGGLMAFVGFRVTRDGQSQDRKSVV